MKDHLPLSSGDSIDVVLAEQIIEKTKTLFPYPTNICGIDGIMIASTTAERLGSYHEGGAVMIQNNWDELAVYDENKYKGTRKGVSRPIRLNKKTIGLIGLTGEVEKVASYSKLLQAFTELLIENSYAYRQARMNEQSLQSFVIHWLTSDHAISKQEFILQVQKFRFVWTGEFSVIVIKSAQSSQLSKDAVRMLHTMHRFMLKTDSQKNLFILYDLYIIWVTSVQPGKKLYAQAETLLKEAEKWQKSPLFFGIGKKYENHQYGKQSFNEALKAAHLAEANNPIVDYHENLVSIALYSIPEDIKKECVDQVFNGCSEAEVLDIANFTTVYRQCNGSINEIAGRLHLHKNSVQYRISKISERLGFDIRAIGNQVRLQIACELLRKTGGEGS
ncbi:MAG: helix-turn-helix domain-containing protein [Treponema sp.]|nr:helix-turn-helix domain-containing protein [Treponema sp.]